MRKKNAHAWQKQMHIIEHSGTKEENPYNYAHEKKNRKKEKKKDFFNAPLEL